MAELDYIGRLKTNTILLTNNHSMLAYMKASSVDVAGDFRNRVSPCKAWRRLPTGAVGFSSGARGFQIWNPGTNAGAMETTLPAYIESCTVLEIHLRARLRFCCFAAVLSVCRMAAALSV